MLMQANPELLAVNSITPEGDDALLVNIRAVIDAVEDNYDYVLRFDDPFGLAPIIRNAIGWTERDSPPA